MPAGRPTDYNAAIAQTICERLADGQSLREICRDDDMPGRTTVLRWLNEHEEFRGQYAIAREAQADHMADEILEIADDASNDWMTRKVGEDEVQVLNTEHVNRSRLRVDSRKWLLAKIMPKKYGERVQHANDPDDPLMPAPADQRELAKAIVSALGSAVKPD
jgi:hypothetical protein